MMTTIDALPQDILLIIIHHLSAYDLLRLQLTSQLCRNVFSDPLLLRTIIRRHPHSREYRQLSHDCNIQHLFNTLATRSFHHNHARPRSIAKHSLRALDQSGHWFPLPQWDYHESQPGGRLYHESAASHLRMSSRSWKPYLFRPTLWSYNDGMVVFAPTAQEKQTRNAYLYGATSAQEDLCFKVVDIESGEETMVPFDVAGKIVRNLRLNDGVLVVEWAEREPYHDLNMVDRVHRHFATFYGVRRQIASERVGFDKTGRDKDKGVDDGNEHEADKHEMKSNDTSDSEREEMCTTLTVTFRSELKFHFLGFPLTSRDYFFSTHTSKHYSSYYWQPNRSLWTGDEDQPIEALAIWDISQSSKYEPSRDPTGFHRPEVGKIGPRIVARFTWRELQWLGLRQGSSIALMGLEIDSEASTMTFKENAFVSGQGYFDPAERHWSARVSSFPFSIEGLSDPVEGPVFQRTGEVDLPSYRGHCSMESSAIGEIEKWYLPVMDMFDESSGVRYNLIETCFTGVAMENKIMLRIKTDKSAEWMNFEDDVVKELTAMGRIAGDDRWIVGQNSKLQLVVARFQ